MNTATDASTKPKRRRGRWIVVALLLITGAFLWFLPTIIARTALRDVFLNAILDAPQYKVSTGGASFGWSTPLVVDDLTINKVDDTATLSIKKLTADQSWFAMWLSRPELGTLTIDQPNVEVVVQTVEDAQDSSAESMPVLTAEINQGHIVVRNEKNDEPEIDLENIDLTAHLERVESISFLRIDQLNVLDRVRLTPELCRSGLRLITPVFADEVDVRGEVSLDLAKTRLPFGASHDEFSKLVEVEGTLEIHRASASIKNSVTQRLAKMFAELLDLGEIPDEWKLAEDAKIQFHVHDGRIVHEALSIILPDIAPDFAIGIGGSVSLDEQIDLRVSAQLPRALLGDSPLAKQIAQTPIDIRISGTIDRPVFALPPDPKWVIQLSDGLTSETLTPEEKELADDFITIIGQLHAADQQVPIPAKLLSRIKQIIPAADPPSQ